MKQRLPRKGKFPDTELSFQHTEDAKFIHTGRMIGRQNTISISSTEPIDNRDKLFFSNFLKSLISFIPGCLVLSIYIYGDNKHR